MLVLTCLVYGGLNHVIFRFRLCCFSLSVVLLLIFGVWVRLGLWPALCSASSYSGLASLNISLELEMLERRACMDWGIFLVMTGGWLDSVWTYMCEFPCLVYGLYSFLHTVGGGKPPSPPLGHFAPLLWPPLTNPGCTTVTGIAKMHKGPCSPLIGVK